MAQTDPDLAAFLVDLETQKRSRFTVKHYGLTVGKFLRWLAEERANPAMRLRDATPSDLRQYQIHLVSRANVAKNTLYITIKALQSFYRFLDLETADDLKPPKRSQSLPKYLTEAEARRLLEAAGGNARSAALVALLLYAGLRVGELTRLALNDVDFEETTVRVRSGKGDKDRLVIVTEKVVGILRNWLEKRPKTASDYLFPGKGGERPMATLGVQRLVTKTARAAGLTKKVTPHVLRHTLATTLLRRGGDIRFIQRILGHASIATTQIYTHLDDAELKRMYSAAAPDF